IVIECPRIGAGDRHEADRGRAEIDDDRRRRFRLRIYRHSPKRFRPAGRFEGRVVDAADHVSGRLPCAHRRLPASPLPSSAPNDGTGLALSPTVFAGHSAPTVIFLTAQVFFSWGAEYFPVGGFFPCRCVWRTTRSAVLPDSRRTANGLARDTLRYFARLAEPSGFCRRQSGPQRTTQRVRSPLMGTLPRYCRSLARMSSSVPKKIAR